MARPRELSAPTRFLVRSAPLTAAVLGVIAFAGCAPLAPAPTDEPAASPSASAATQTAPAQPALVPDGSASDNLPLFQAVTEQVWASGDRASGRAYIDALTAAGFDKTSMQVTNDTSTVGNAAESIQFSVQWHDECLLGQVGPATGDPVATVMPVLPEGGCLIGQTRPIDW